MSAERLPMRTTTIDGRSFRVYPAAGGTETSHIYFMDVAAQPIDGEALARKLSSTLICCEITDWNDDMTPWPMQGIYRGEGIYAGQADAMLDSLIEHAVPRIEAMLDERPAHRALTGYSLGGLFATYGFLNSSSFDAMASMSGSFWYEGWTDYLDRLGDDHRDITRLPAYFSLGDKEHKARPAILRSVRENTELTFHAFERWGAHAEFHLNPGTHFDDIEARVLQGFLALEDSFVIGK